jgi:hypothetical protein
VKGAVYKVCCGLGVRAVRAGSIGRDTQVPDERTDLPPEEAGGLGPRPIHEEISALVPSGMHGPQGHGGIELLRQTFIQSGQPPVTE